MEKKNSIFIISTEFPPGPGGIGSHAYQVAKELHRLGWVVTVFSEQEYSTAEEIEKFNTRALFKIFRLFPTPSMFLLLLKFMKLFWASLQHSPDVILGTGKHGAWFAVLVGKLTFKKTVVIGHGTEFIITMSGKSQKINKRVYSSANAIIHVSGYTQKIAETAGVINNNSFIIHNGADNELFYKLEDKHIADFKRRKSLEGKKIIVTVGNVQTRKGHEWVIRSMPEILRSVPNAHYYCVGLPTIKTHLEKIVGELQLNGHVHFIGKVNQQELLNWLNAADVFAMTSIATDYGDVEGFGIAVIEAALCGIPAVVTNESGPGEAIIENVTGFGAKEKDTTIIAQRITMLLQDQNLRNSMGQSALNNAIQNLTWAIVVKKYNTVLSDLITKS